MTSPSPVSSAAAPQTICSEEVMDMLTEIKAQLTSISRKQDGLIELIVDLGNELKTRTESAIRAPASSTTTQSSPERTSPTVPNEADSAAINSASSPSQDAESAPEPQSNKPTLPVPAPERRLRRQNAFYHISNAGEAPWKAPGGYHPYRDNTHPTRGRPTPERPACPPPQSLHPLVSRQRVSNSLDEGRRLPPPYTPSPYRLSAQQGSQSSFPAPPLPQADGALILPPPAATATLPALPVQHAPTSCAHPLRRESAFIHVSWLARTPFVAPGPGTPRPPPYSPTTAPTTPAAPLPSPKRKREDAEDTADSAEASDKKRARRPSTDDVD